MKTRIHLTLEGTTIHLLNRLQKENSIPLGQAVDLLARNELERNKADSLAEVVAKRVIEELKKA